MLHNFILQNVHFVIGLVTGFVFFAVAWLYLDAWASQKTLKHAAKVSGFVLLSIASLLQATVLEQTLLSSAYTSSSFISYVALTIKLLGYGLVMIGLIMDKIQPRPLYNVDGNSQNMPTSLLAVTTGVTAVTFPAGMFLAPILCTIIAFLYLRRATIGIENHLKPVTLAFFVLAFSEIISLTSLFQQTSNPVLASFVAPFSPLWIFQQCIQLVGVVILGRWVFQYLFQRIQTQLFMFFVLTVMTAFLITTISFTTLLLRNLQNNALTHLQTDVKVLQYAVSVKKDQTRSDAQVFAQNPEVISAILEENSNTLKTISSSFLINKEQSFLTLISPTGVVLVRGEDPDRKGDSISDDPIAQRVLRGETVSTVVKRQGVLAPEISIRSAVPIIQESTIIGAVIIGSRIDNAFVDGIKQTTNLDVSVYSDNIRSATTFVAADGKSRSIGVKETSAEITTKVLKDSQIYTGTRDILNSSYVTVFAPLLDADNIPVGMLFVGKEEVTILQAAAESIQTTFFVAALLLVFSLIPAYLISRYISYQIH